MDETPFKSPEEVIAEYKASQHLKSQKRMKIVAVAIFIFVVLSVIGNITNKGDKSNLSAPSVSPTVASYDDSWIPSGFTGYADDDNLAWRWATKSEVNCTYSSGACWSAILISKEGCKSSLYGEVNIFDRNKVQISYTNDSVGRVQPMQKVKLTFDTLDDSADSANISKFSCY